MAAQGPRPRPPLLNTARPYHFHIFWTHFDAQNRNEDCTPRIHYLRLPLCGPTLLSRTSRGVSQFLSYGHWSSNDAEPPDQGPREVLDQNKADVTAREARSYEHGRTSAAFVGSYGDFKGHMCVGRKFRPLGIRKVPLMFPHQERQAAAPSHQHRLPLTGPAERGLGGCGMDNMAAPGHWGAPVRTPASQPLGPAPSGAAAGGTSTSRQVYGVPRWPL